MIRKRSLPFVAAIVAVAGTCAMSAHAVTTNIVYAKRDLVAPFYIPDDTTTAYTVEGVVTTPNLGDPPALDARVEFYIQDLTDDVGIKVYYLDEAPPDDFMTVNGIEVGMKIRVFDALIDQLNGERRIRPVTSYDLQVLNGGAIVPFDPITNTISGLLANAEDLEGTFIKIENVTLNPTPAYPGLGNNGILTISDGTGSMTLFVDRHSDAPGQLAPTNAFDLLGVLSQFDTSTNNLPDGPTNDYQVLARYYSDLIQDVPADSPPALDILPFDPAAAGVETRITLVAQDRNVGDTLTLGNLSGFGSIAFVTNRVSEFTWTPSLVDEGTTNTLIFTVSDGTTIVTQQTSIVVEPPRTNNWDFETGFQGFTVRNVSGDYTWQRLSGFGGALGSTFYVQMDGFFDPAFNSDDWLVSPGLDLNNYPDPVLTFWRDWYYDGSTLTLRASTDYTGGSPATNGTWDTLGVIAPLVTEWQEAFQSLAAYATEANFHFAFQYTGVQIPSRQWRLDEIAIKGKEPPQFTAPTQDQVVFVGGTLVIDVETLDYHGDATTITTNLAPANSTFLDNTDGTASYTFTPDGSQVGNQVLELVATDVDGSTTNSINILVAGKITAPVLWDFEAGVTPWFSYNKAGGLEWERRSGAGAQGTTWYMYMNGYEGGGTNQSDDWLISPAIDMTALMDPKLQYWKFQNFPPGGTFTLNLSTNYSGSGDPTAGGATWTDLGLTPPAALATWTPATNSLAAYVGHPSVYLAFRYTSPGSSSSLSDWWQIDQVRLTAINQPPEFIPPLETNYTLTAGSVLNVEVVASEIDGDLVTLSASNIPLNATFATTSHVGAVTNTFSFAPTAGQAGVHSVTFIASDKDGTNTTTSTFTVVTDPDFNIMVTEIMNNPAGVPDAVGEYFEVYNNGAVAVDINGWTIKDNDTDIHVISNGAPLVVSAKDFLVLGVTTDTGVNGGVPVDYAYGTSWFLANGADEIILLNATSVEVDRVEYDGGPVFPDPTGASMELISPDVDNNVGGNWTTATTSWPGNTSGDKGSPGAANEFGTWGGPSGPVDTDDDGIPDDWEDIWCGGITNCVATVDIDLDTFNYLEEYIADTDPTDSNSFFAITSYAGTGTLFAVQFEGSSNRLYLVEKTPDLVVTNWVEVAPEFQPASSGLQTVLDDVGGVTNKMEKYRGNVRVP